VLGFPFKHSFEKGFRATGLSSGDAVGERVGLDGALGVFLACKQNHNPHPIFGAMKPWDWMRWGYLHADHHLRQFGR